MIQGFRWRRAAAVLISFCFSLTALAAQTAASPSSQATTSFDEVVRQAAAARDGGRLDEAIRLYRDAVSDRPAWSEGWWYLGTLNYDLDRYAEARDAFRRLVQLEPGSGVGLTLLGLCEYRTKDYADAARHLEEGRTKGLPDRSMSYISRYHSALLMNKSGQFEAALSTLNLMALENPDSPQIAEGLGIGVLRLPVLPEELTEEQKPAVALAGQAAMAQATQKPDEARKYFDQLANSYPTMPHVHYSRGIFFLVTNPDAALQEFNKELEISPKHVPALLSIAFEYLKRGDYAKAVPPAREAVKLEPDSFVARNALGRALLDSGETEAAIKELEYGAKLAPDSPDMFFALVRAYRKANRTHEAEEALAEFKKLDEIRRARREKAPAAAPAAKP